MSVQRLSRDVKHRMLVHEESGLYYIYKLSRTLWKKKQFIFFYTIKKLSVVVGRL